MNSCYLRTKIYFGKFFLTVLIMICCISHVNSQLDGYWIMSVRERAEALGFGYEEYQVTTEDGYVLSLMRIPNGPESSSDIDVLQLKLYGCYIKPLQLLNQYLLLKITNKEPILMSHPAFETTEAYTSLGGVYSPAFYFAIINDNYKIR